MRVAWVSTGKPAEISTMVEGQSGGRVEEEWWWHSDQ